MKKKFDYREYFKNLGELINSDKNLIKKLEILEKKIIACKKKNKKVMIFGNGGSAADSQHIAAELVGRFKIQRKGLPAIALTTDSSVVTSIANDFGFNKVFERQVEALANNNDVAIGISTSGNSKNVIKGLEMANKLDCSTIGFSGNDGGVMNSICNININIPSSVTARIQEMHIIIGHTLCHLIEQDLKS